MILRRIGAGEKEFEEFTGHIVRVLVELHSKVGLASRFGPHNMSDI